MVALACICSTPIIVDARKRTKGERPDASSTDVRLATRRTSLAAAAATAPPFPPSPPLTAERGGGCSAPCPLPPPPTRPGPAADTSTQLRKVNSPLLDSVDAGLRAMQVAMARVGLTAAPTPATTSRAPLPVPAPDGAAARIAAAVFVAAAGAEPTAMGNAATEWSVDRQADRAADRQGAWRRHQVGPQSRSGAWRTRTWRSVDARR